MIAASNPIIIPCSFLALLPSSYPASFLLPSRNRNRSLVSIYSSPVYVIRRRMSNRRDPDFNRILCFFFQINILGVLTAVRANSDEAVTLSSLPKSDLYGYSVDNLSEPLPISSRLAAFLLVGTPTLRFLGFYRVFKLIAQAAIIAAPG